MIVFGGFIGGNQAEYSRSIIYYDFTKNCWDVYYIQSKKKEKGAIRPKKRANSTLGIFQDKLYIFGGTNGKNKLNDMWKFDLNTRIWVEINAKDNSSFPDVNIIHI